MAMSVAAMLRGGDFTHSLPSADLSTPTSRNRGVKLERLYGFCR
jgi:hypothetical protein